LYRQSLDNVTAVLVAFQNFKRQVFGKSKNSERSAQKNDHTKHSSAMSSVHEFMANTFESQKENIHSNKQYKSGGIGSFLSQRHPTQTDENVPPSSSNFPQSAKIGGKNASMKPPASAALQGTIHNSKNMNHLLSNMNGTTQHRSDSQPHGEALKEKTGMFINRTYQQQ